MDLSLKQPLYGWADPQAAITVHAPLPHFYTVSLRRTVQAQSVPHVMVPQGFYWLPSLAGPTTIAARQSGSGTAWLLPFVDGAPASGWDEALPYLVLPTLLVAAQVCLCACKLESVACHYATRPSSLTQLTESLTSLLLMPSLLLCTVH